MRKKIVFILLAGLLIILLSITANLYTYFNNYNIEDNRNQLEENILLRLNKPTKIIDNIDIIKTIDLGNKKYVIFMVNYYLGHAEFLKGFNDKFKIGATGYGSNLIKYQIDKINNTNYFFLFGKNPDLKISYGTLLLDGKEYKFNIPSEEYFITYSKVSTKTQIKYPEISNIKFFDKNGMDITYLVLSAICI